MKLLFKILGIILGIIALYCIVAIVFFKKNYHYEQSILIAAPKEKVWANTNSMKGINLWNPWMKLDPNLKGDYKGKSGEVGDYYHWKGNSDVGEGEQAITALTPHEKTTTKIHFIEPFESQSTSNITLISEGDATKVTWDINFKIDNLMLPLKPFMDKNMKKSYKEGLEKLKTISEK